MPNPQGFTLRDVLEVEDDPALLAFRCEVTGIVFWPLIRTTFVRMILSDLLYGRPITGAKGRSIASVQGLSTLGRSVLHNRRHARSWPSDICLMPTALGHVMQDGRVFNRLADHFALCMPQRTLVWEDQFDWRWPFPRRFERVLFHAPVAVYGALLGRALVRRQHRQAAAALVDLVATRAEQRLQWVLGDARRAQLVTMLSRKIPQMPGLYAHYREALQRHATRLLIKEDGSYGPSAMLCAAARSLGVVVAEYQHGAVSTGHDAYNLAPTLRQSEDYHRTMPEYYLSYGTWWNGQIDVPRRRIAIGNPHRSEVLTARLARNLPALAKTDILVLGDGIETEMYLGFVRSLQPMARRMGMKLVFRPHPMERTRVPTDGSEGFAVDLNADIYTSFEQAYAVISEMSTGLFEAVGLAERVLLWNTEKARFAFPQHFFESFDNLEQLTAVLEGGTGRPVDPTNTDATWAPGWRNNYRSFIAQVLPATQDIPS